MDGYWRLLRQRVALRAYTTGRRDLLERAVRVHQWTHQLHPGECPFRFLGALCKQSRAQPPAGAEAAAAQEQRLARQAAARQARAAQLQRTAEAEAGGEAQGQASESQGCPKAAWQASQGWAGPSTRPSSSGAPARRPCAPCKVPLPPPGGGRAGAPGGGGGRAWGVTAVVPLLNGFA